MKDYKLTGEFYHRKAFSGMVLYVEVQMRHFNLEGPFGLKDFTETKYKRANQHDSYELVKLMQRTETK